MILYYFGGYLSTEADVTAWAISAREKCPDLVVRTFPYPVDTSASHPLGGWPPGRSAELAQEIKNATAPVIIVGHSSGCGIANDVASRALALGAYFRLIALDGNTPGRALLAHHGTVRWSAVGPNGETSLNYLSADPPHYRVYAAKVSKRWPLHGSLVNINVSDEHPEIRDIYWNCSANLEVLGLEAVVA